MAQSVDPVRIKKVRKASYEEARFPDDIDQLQRASFVVCLHSHLCQRDGSCRGVRRIRDGMGFRLHTIFSMILTWRRSDGQLEEGIREAGRKENPFWSLSGHSSKSGSLRIYIPLIPFLLSRTGPKRKIAFEREERREVLFSFSFPYR